MRQFWNITSGIYAKYHVQIMLLFVYTTTRKRFVIFTCRYFKLSWNTTALSQSNCRNFSCSIKGWITRGLTIRRTRKFIPPPWYKGGWMEPFPGVFNMLQYKFETILPLVESLWSSWEHEVYFMGCGAAGGLWRRQQWSPSWLPSWILPRIGNQGPVVRTPVRANLRLNFNPGFFFLLSKALSRIIFFILFRVSSHQIVGREN